MTVQQVSVNFITRYSSRGIRQFQRDMAQVGATAQATAGSTSAALSRVGAASQTAGTALLIGVGAALAVGIKAAIDFEDAFAGVRKTVDASEAEFQVLAEVIRQMALDIPVAATELSRIAELGGQLGVPVEGLEQFTEVIAKLGVTTNLEIDEAATALARFANVMGSSDDEFENIASALVDLGNNVAAQEDEILAFATRLAGIGQVIGLTEGEVLGLAAAFVELGVPAERGATAVQRTFIAMLEAVQNGGEELMMFAETANMSAEEFVQTFAEDPAQALIEFERGLGRVANEGGNVTGILDAVGLGSQRVTEVLLKGAGAWQGLSTNVARGNRAFEENIALNEEADKRFGTMASQIQLLVNSFNDLRIEIGTRVEPAVREVLGAFSGLFEIIRENFDVLKTLAILTFALAGARGLLGLGKALANTAVLAGEASVKLTGLGVAGLRAQSGIAKLGLGVRAFGGVLGLATIALGGLALAMGVARSRANANREALGALIDTIEDFKKGTQSAKDVFEAFNLALNQPNALFDITVDLQDRQLREAFLTGGTTADILVDLAINDPEEFERRAEETIQTLQRRVDQIKSGDIAVGATVFGTPSELRQAELDLVRVSKAIAEIRSETVLLREEEERRREEERTRGGTGRNFPRGPRVSQADRFFISGFRGTADEYQATLDDMFGATSDFGSDFLGKWFEIMDGIHEVLFDYETAFDGFKTTTEFNLGELTASMDNWIEEQRNITSAMAFVVQNFGDEAANMFMALPQEVQAQLGAAMAAGAGGDIMEFWADLITQNEDLYQERLLRALLVAPSTASQLTGDWEQFFNNELVPIFEEAGGVEGSQAFNEAVSRMFPMLMAQIAQEAPELAVAIGDMLNTAAESAKESIDPSKLAEVANIMRSELSTTERILAFVALGLDWADAIALGFSNLPLLMTDVAKRATSAVDRAAREGFIIESPSKLSAEWGKQIAAGFNKGLMSNMVDPNFFSRAFRSPMAPIVNVSTPPSSRDLNIAINHPQHRNDDILASLQEATTLTGLVRAAEVVPGAG